MTRCFSTWIEWCVEMCIVNSTAQCRCDWLSNFLQCIFGCALVTIFHILRLAVLLRIFPLSHNFLHWLSMPIQPRLFFFSLLHLLLCKKKIHADRAQQKIRNYNRLWLKSNFVCSILCWIYSFFRLLKWCYTSHLHSLIQMQCSTNPRFTVKLLRIIQMCV